MPFSQVNFHKCDKACRDLCSVDHTKTCNCFSKICKVQIEFFTNIRMTRNPVKKNKSYDKTALWNKQYKKVVNLILENPMPKAITEVYFELLVTIFYAQISCSCHLKFVKIISILKHRIAINVFVYIHFPASNKMFWLACPTNSGQK